MIMPIVLLPPPSRDIEYNVRVLTVDETQTLAPIFHAKGVELPNPATSFIVGAVTTDGKITDNFLVAQLRLHAEPLNLVPGNEHLFRRLVKTLETEISQRVGDCDVFLFAPVGKVEQMARSMGMDREPWSVMSKHVDAPKPVERPKLEIVPLVPVTVERRLHPVAVKPVEVEIVTPYQFTVQDGLPETEPSNLDEGAWYAATHTKPVEVLVGSPVILDEYEDYLRELEQEQLLQEAD